MLIRVSGYNSGVKEYLEEGVKNGRDYSRDELDERVILHGDLDVTDRVYKSIPDRGQNRYTTFTLAFREDEISNDTLSSITNEFREFMMYAYEQEEYNFYAEAHLPKIKEVFDKRTGERIERKPHIHIVVPKINLLSGRVNDVIGDHDSTERYLEAFQEYINQKYKLASPRDHVRVNPYNAADVLSRYKGDDFRGKNREFKEALVKEIIDDNIRSRQDFYSAVSKHGETRIRNSGKGNEYIAVKIPGDDKFTNLKETIFNDSFIIDRKLTKPPLDKHVISDRLHEWPMRAKEIKYVAKANKSFREKYYKSANVAEKINLLANEQYKFYEKFGGQNELHPTERAGSDQRSITEIGRGRVNGVANSLQSLSGGDVAADRQSRSATGAVFLPGNACVYLELPESGGNPGLRSDLYVGGTGGTEAHREGGETDKRGSAGASPGGRKSGEGRASEEAGARKRGAEEREAGSETREGGESAVTTAKGRSGGSRESSERSVEGREEEAERSTVNDTRRGYNSSTSNSYPNDPGSRAEHRFTSIPELGRRNASFSVRGGLQGSGNRQLDIPVYARNTRYVNDITAVVSNSARLFSSTAGAASAKRSPAKLIRRVIPRAPKTASYIAACLQRRQEQNSLTGSQRSALYQADQKYYQTRRAIISDKRLSTKDKGQLLSVLMFERLKAHQLINHPPRYNPKEYQEMGSADIRSKIKPEPKFRNTVSGVEEEENAKQGARERFRKMAAQVEENLGERSIREKVRIITAADIYTRKAKLSDNIHYLDKSSDKTLFIDTGKSIAVSKNGLSESAVAVALELAKEKFGSTLTVKGTQAFKNTAIEVVAQKGLDIHFTDKEMNRRLAERKAELAVERENQNITQGKAPAPEPKTREEFAEAFREVEQRYEAVLSNADGLTLEEINKELQEISATRKALTTASLALDVETALSTPPEQSSESLDDRCRSLETELEKLSEQKAFAEQVQNPAVSENAQMAEIPLPATREELVDAFRTVEQRYEEVLGNAENMSAGELSKQLQELGQMRQALSRASLAIDVEASLNASPEGESESLDDRSRNLESELKTLRDQKAEVSQPQHEAQTQPLSENIQAPAESYSLTRDELIDAFSTVEQRYEQVLSNADSMSAGEINKQLQEIGEIRKSLTRSSLAMDVEASLNGAPGQGSEGLDDRSRGLESQLRKLSEVKTSTEQPQISNKNEPQAAKAPASREEFINAFRAVEERYENVLRNAGGMSAAEIGDALQSIREERKALTSASLAHDVEASLGTAPVSMSTSLDDRSRDLEVRLRQVAESRAATQPEQPQRDDSAHEPKRIVHEGVLLEHGEAPYQFKPDMRKPEGERNDSYFVRIRKPDGAEKVVWGVTLESAVAGIEAGENIRLENLGKQKVEWTQQMADGTSEQRTGERVAWRGTAIDRDVDRAGTEQDTSYEETTYEETTYENYGSDVA